MRVLGIDEAGRGCVLGPLVVAGFMVEADVEPELWVLGAADSKTLTPERRLEVRSALAAVGRAEVRVVGATEIDGDNLNRLEEQAILDLVRTTRPDRVIVDALGHPAALPGIVARLRQHDDAGAGVEGRWIMEPRADANHATVAAASIFAKTTRDTAVEALRAEWGPFGSGYPSDPETRAWLTDWSATGRPWPPFVRTRWRTIDLVNQQSLF